VARPLRYGFEEIVLLIVKPYPFFIFCSVYLASTAAADQGRVCGSQVLAHYRQTHPQEAAKPLAPTLQEPDEIIVGTPLEFVDIFSGGLLIPATCRYVGEHSYIFVQDSRWDENGGPVDQSHVDGLGRVFDRTTPTDPEQGIFQLSTEAFGAVPDVDGRERIFIVILNINRANVVGFFDPGVATHPDLALRRDTVYLDEFAVRRQTFLARGTLAHEFQHLIHWGHDPDEELWVNEGLSGYAEQVAGYPEADPAAVPAFLARPDSDLTLWQDTPYNYGSTFLFMAFLAERYGGDYIRRLVSEQRNGIFGIEAAFTSAGLEQNFSGAWGEWSVGNMVAADPFYGYDALQGRRVQNIPVERLPLEPAEGVVGSQWGTFNILFRTPGNIAVDFSGDESGQFRVWSYAMRGGQGVLEKMPLDALNQGRAEVAGVDSLALIIGLTSPLGGDFTISAQEFVLTAIDASDTGPDATRLEALYPNPFNGSALIPFALAHYSKVELSVYNTLGQRVRILDKGLYGAGQYRLEWDGRDDAGAVAASGLYIVQLNIVEQKAGQTRFKRRLSLVK
jgi:hypothetical protein